MREVKQQSVRELIEQYLDEGVGLEDMVKRFRNSVVVHAMARSNGNQVHAAKLLKTHRNNLVRWLNEFQIDADEFREAPGNGTHG
jgi:DNA-binding NtrC family response regulator